ncbi:hypothetical protein [uncultured Stenotrophomonas sp.]|uniref:hypothetical protein n=1 Tax=uncultured Stenotrophomonas sp. TaxID=165438 RepID=UPI0025E5EB64|nr:hypothetical protein [uncultured Stenotrophomonas sp.]
MDLYSAKCVAEAALGVIFEERDSAYQGGMYYRYVGRDSENMVLKINVDPIDGAPAEVAFPQYPVLLYVNSTRRASGLEEAIGRCGMFELLRRERL